MGERYGLGLFVFVYMHCACTPRVNKQPQAIFLCKTGTYWDKIHILQHPEDTASDSFLSLFLKLTNY